MSNFISYQDYETLIQDQHLNQIIDYDNFLLDKAENDAVAEVRSYLHDYYKTETIFAQTGENRASIVVNWCKYVVLYKIYDRVPDEFVPERVVKNYDDTIKTLEKIAEGQRGVDLPRRETEEGEASTKFRWGSQPKRTH